MARKGSHKATSQQQESGLSSVISTITRSRLLSMLLSLVVFVLIGIIVVAFVQGRSISFWPPSIGAIPTATTQSATPTIGATPSSVNNNLLSLEKMLIQRIDFDYQDSPTKHGWVMLEGEADETQLVIKHISDQFVGSAISISSPVKYGMEFQVGLPATQLGRVVEFVADFEESTTIYTFVSLERDDRSTTTGWLQFKVGKGQPKPIEVGTNTGEDEWQIFIEPVSMKGGEWLLFQVDLQDAVMQTFGNDEWRFQELKKIRVRGDLSLDYISIFKVQS